MPHLTDEDRSFFKDNGFLIKRGLLRCSGDDSVPPGCGDLPLEDLLSRSSEGGTGVTSASSWRSRRKATALDRPKMAANGWRRSWTGSLPKQVTDEGFTSEGLE